MDNGVGTVGKGDVQSALGWNNAAFDKGVGTLKFTAGAEKVIADYKMSCFNGTTGAIDAEVSHQIISQPGTTTVTATPVLNAGNGKQITGFNLTGQTTGFTATGGATLRTVPCPEGSFHYMNLGQGDLFGKTQITGGLQGQRRRPAEHPGHRGRLTHPAPQQPTRTTQRPQAYSAGGACRFDPGLIHSK